MMAATQLDFDDTADDASQLKAAPLWAFESRIGKPPSQGAAAIVHKCRGADQKIFNGETGSNCAIATRDAEDQLLPCENIESHVEEFLRFSKANPTTPFTVLPGPQKKTPAEQERFTDLLRNAPQNVVLPGRMLESLDRLHTVRIVILDANFSVDERERKRVLDQYFSANRGLWDADAIEIVSFGSYQSIVSNDKFANELGFRHRIMHADEHIYGDYALQARDILSIGYATKLVCLNDPTGTSTGNQVGSLHLAAGADLQIDESLIE